MAVFRTVHNKIVVLILISLALVGSSFLATYITVQTHLRDEAIIELLHNRLPVAQELTSLALDGRGTEVDSAVLAYDRDLELVHEAMAKLEESTPLLSPRAILRHVDALDEAWGAYRLSLTRVSELSVDDPSRPQAEQILGAQGINLAAQAEELSHALEAYSNSRHILLLRMQIVFVFIAGLFTLLGYLLIRQRVVRPLSILNQATQQIKQGALNNPLDISGEDEIGQLARSFDQMRIAVLQEQAELERRVSDRTSEIATAFEFSQEIVSQLDLDHLIKSVADKTRTLMRAEDSNLCLVTPDGCSVEMASTTDSRPVNRKQSQPIRDNLPEITVTNQRAITAQVSKLGCAFLQRSPDDHCLAAPLRVGEQTIGAMCVVRGKEEPFQGEETLAFTLLANSAAIAILNSRYAEEARQLARRTAVQSERERLASELHDNLAQTLNLVNLKVTQIQQMFDGPERWVAQAEMEIVKTNVALAIEQVRMVASELATPDQLHESELLMKLDAAVKEFEEMTGIPIEVTGAGPFLSRLPALTQKQILMIIGESLANIHRHAQAENVGIRFRAEQDNVYVTIEDDGQGFRPEMIQGNHHLGLHIMRRRAERIGGTLQIGSVVGSGTQVTGSFPLEKEHLE